MRVLVTLLLMGVATAAMAQIPGEMPPKPSQHSVNPSSMPAQPLNSDGALCLRTSVVSVGGLDLDLKKCMDTIDIQETARVAVTDRINFVQTEANRRLCMGDLVTEKSRTAALIEYWHQWCQGEHTCE